MIDLVAVAMLVFLQETHQLQIQSKLSSEGTIRSCVNS